MAKRKLRACFSFYALHDQHRRGISRIGSFTPGQAIFNCEVSVIISEIKVPQPIAVLQGKSMTNPSIVIVGASNLVSFKRQPLVACNCPTVCVSKDNYVTGIPPDVTFQVIAKP